MNDYIIVPLAISVAVVTLTYILLEFWRGNRNLPPGPWGVPFMGYYPFLTSQLNLDFSNLAKRYGDLFSFRSCGALVIVLNGTKNIRGTLVERAEEFIGKPLQTNFMEWMSDGKGIADSEGSVWKEHRRYFLHTAKNFGFGKVEIEDAIHHGIRMLVEDLRNTNGQPTNLAFHLDYVVNSSIWEIVFGKTIDKNGELFRRFQKASHVLIDHISDRRFMLVGKYFHLDLNVLPWAAEVRRSRIIVRKTIEGIIEEHVRSFDRQNLRGYVDSYLFEMEKLRKNGQLQNSSFTMERLIAITVNMTVAGTVGDSIAALVYRVSQQPREQEKVQQELDSVLGKDGLVSWHDRKRLPYLDAFIQELYRTASPFPLTLLYSNFQETTINGYRIPKRSIIVGNLWSIHSDPEIYENPSLFNVDRFLGEGGQRIRTEGPYPFGMGKRACIGQSLAQVEVFLTIGSILQHFTLHSTDVAGLVKAVPRYEI